MIRFSASSATAVASGIAALALVSATPAIADDTSEDALSNEAPAELSKGEARLAKMLEGREAGEPQNCISGLRHRNMTTIHDTAYVYGRGRTIYVQRTRNPESIDRHEVLVTRRTNGSQICRFDIAKTIDRNGGFFSGVVQFEEFVPYTRVEDKGEAAR